MRRLLFLLALALVASQALAQTQPATTQATTKPHNFERWEAAIQKFETSDKAKPPRKGGIVFTGSSTIGGWKTLKTDFPNQIVHNRGFGGSQIIDAVHFAPRIIIPYEPKAVFLRSGGNDLHAGKSPEQCLEDFKQFVNVVHAKLPDTVVYWIALNPTPVRASETEANKKLNSLVADYVKSTPNAGFVDAYDISLDESGNIREELFLKDRLHFNAEGYKRLIARVRPFVEQFQTATP